MSTLTVTANGQVALRKDLLKQLGEAQSEIEAMRLSN